MCGCVCDIILPASPIEYHATVQSWRNHDVIPFAAKFSLRALDLDVR